MQIKFILNDGTVRVTQGSPGISLMQLALNSSIPGIAADCGGACACATCHVRIAEEWIARTGAAGFVEADLLELVDDRSEDSRLACQIPLDEGLDGLVVHVPGS